MARPVLSIDGCDNDAVLCFQREKNTELSDDRLFVILIKMKNVCIKM